MDRIFLIGIEKLNSISLYSLLCTTQNKLKIRYIFKGHDHVTGHRSNSKTQNIKLRELIFKNNCVRNLEKGNFLSFLLLLFFFYIGYKRSVHKNIKDR